MISFRWKYTFSRTLTPDPYPKSNFNPTSSPSLIPTHTLKLLRRPCGSAATPWAGAVCWRTGRMARTVACCWRPHPTQTPARATGRCGQTDVSLDRHKVSS